LLLESIRVRDREQFATVFGGSPPGCALAAALEEIRGRHLLAQRLRHRHHVEAGAVAGEISSSPVQRH
jgi:hypothetical protein